jgi:starch synthase
MIASELAPFSKTGGLADVASALPLALGRAGHDVTIVTPRYRGVTAGQWRSDVSAVVAGATIQAGIFEEPLGPGARALLVDCPSLYDRDGLYNAGRVDFDDNPLRFAFLVIAALESAASEPTPIDVVHAHDWQAGLAGTYLIQHFSRHPVLSRVPTVFTIHNLAYHGIFAPEWLSVLGLGWELMHVDALEFWGRISFLKGGIVFSRLITTVSPRYAQEIQTPALGFGFDGILRFRSRDLVGILNGIDYDHWDPARDVHLPEPYSASNLKGKAAAKRAVLETFGIGLGSGLEGALSRPLVGMVSRLVDQKGFDLMAALGGELPSLNATFVLLGTGDRRYEEMWTTLAAQYPDRIGARIGFDEGLAHRIEAGADLFLMPSHFEPCGLNQMYSLRYGTVPLVRATGGLADTVRNYDSATGEGTGFTFSEYSPRALLGTLRWALDTYKDKDAWRRLQRAGMRQDNSWDARARQYVEVYERARR